MSEPQSHPKAPLNPECFVTIRGGAGGVSRGESAYIIVISKTAVVLGFLAWMVFATN